jgi:phosphoribosylformylglycinamidine (FGAM) synthase-like amidotransferase family enzyme
MMPHPERCVYWWQWPFLPGSKPRGEFSPWMAFFKNAFDWCASHE